MCVQYCGGAQYRGGYHEYRGDTMSTVGISLVPWVVFITVGDVMSTVGVFSTMGGYHEYRGGIP